MSIENGHDPRVRLVREKYFSLRPKPLERWLWAQGVPASAERVFWLHWQEGLQRGDWCSEVPIQARGARVLPRSVDGDPGLPAAGADGLYSPHRPRP